MENYSDYFKTLHDETQPTGDKFGRGTHYSILRATVWHDELGNVLEDAKHLDFAIIWDEDHDDRIIHLIEKVYHKGLLPKFIIFGERKGTFTALMADSLMDVLSKPDIMILDREISYISQHENDSGDSWPATITNVSSKNNEIIADTTEKVSLYLSNLIMLWGLGIKDIDYSEQKIKCQIS